MNRLLLINSSRTERQDLNISHWFVQVSTAQIRQWAETHLPQLIKSDDKWAAAVTTISLIDNKND